MKTKNIWLVVLGMLFFVSFSKINAQDLHYSQFYNAPQNINPALTGVFNGDHRYVVSMRDQWRFVPVPWFTMSGAYDRKLYILKGDHHFLGGGISLNHDRQGDASLNLTSLNLNAAYHRILTPHHIVSGGLTLGVASRGFNSQTLTWDKQWDGEVFNSALPTGESFANFERIVFIETGLGLNYRYQKDNRTYLDAGISGLHLVKPNTAFYDPAVSKLPQRFTYNVVGQAKLTEKLDLQLHVLHQVQGPYNETVFGGLAKIHVNQKRGKEIQLHAGMGYRTAQSLIPTLAIQYNNIYAGLSYDIDTNQFNDILRSNKGGPEIHVRYIIAHVKSLKLAKVCPIY
ncbi:MAG: PorP/SprF family type IX secretion system membrane protein [Saprospiraceae bacterium]